jgi:hypothetical protein
MGRTSLAGPVTMPYARVRMQRTGRVERIGRPPIPAGWKRGFIPLATEHDRHTSEEAREPHSRAFSLAEGVGFEPTVRSPTQSLSRRSP